jgi:uncharacterized membrane protein
MNPVVFGSLIFIHVLSGILWACGAYFFGAFVLPAIQEAGPGGGLVMGGVIKRRFPLYMTLWAGLCVLSGAALWATDFNAKGGVDWLKHPEGAVLTLASLGALHAFIKGLLVQKPTAERLGALSIQAAQAQGQPDPALLQELQATQAKLAKLARGAGAELLGVAALMALHQLLAQF